MAKNTFFRTVLFALVLTTAGAGAALAQSTGSTSRPVFGGAGGGSDIGKTIDLTLDAAEVYDQNLTAEAGITSPSAFQVSGFYTLLAPQLRFKSNGTRFQLIASADSNARYFGQTNDFAVTSYDAGVGFNAQMTTRTSVSVSQSVTYAPSYLYGLFARLATPGAGDIAPSSSSYAVDDVRSFGSRQMERSLTIFRRVPPSASPARTTRRTSVEAAIRDIPICARAPKAGISRIAE